MTDSESKNEGQDSVADDWENVAEEQVIAQVAEKQKQIANKQNEEKETQIYDEQDQPPGPAMPSLDLRPIKLLKRPSSGSRINQMATASNRDATTNGANKAKTLEERQAEYERVRERIFGDQAVASSASNEEESAESSGTRNQGQNHLSDVIMKTASDNRRVKVNNPTQWAKIPPQPQVVPLQPTLFITGAGVFPAPPPAFIPPNQLSYPPPMFPQQGTFIPAVNQMPVMPVQQPNFMHPPPTQQTSRNLTPLSSATPAIPDKLKPLQGGRGQAIMNPQRNPMMQSMRPTSNLNSLDFPTLQQVQNPPPTDLSYGRPPPFLLGQYRPSSGTASQQTHMIPSNSQPQMNQ